VQYFHRQVFHLVHRYSLLLSLVALAFFSMPAFALDPALPPGSNFDLSHWYLQLPTSDNKLTGRADWKDAASPSQLVAGFTNAYFYTSDDGAMTLWTPDNGAVMTGAAHPRTELRERLAPENNNLNWSLCGTHVLTAQCRVLQVSSDARKVCIGQIKEPGYLTSGTAKAGNEQMIMVDLGSRKIYAHVSLDGNRPGNFRPTLISGPSVTTNTLINYTMAVSNGVLTITVNDVTHSWDLFSGTNYLGLAATNWSPASGNTVYFKAGDYNQTANACGCSDDGARVAFYHLAIYHAPAITNPPAAQTGPPGGSATFNVGAVGNGRLSYQWLFNSANPIPGATNASLTLANLSAQNVGDYSVVVSDSTPGFSVVTSTIAPLTLKVASGAQ
jgi:hypothetical protein